jgi:hypothetical protein
MNIAELKAWVSAKFWNSEQVAAWARNNFVQRSQVRLDNYTLTVTGNSTVNGSLVGNMTGGGTVATGGFTGTLPATGTLALRSAAQTFTGLQTFSNGIAFANETLSTYDQGTWTPVVTCTTPGTSVIGYTSRSGTYTRIGNVVFYAAAITVSSYTLGTASGNLIISLPLTVSTQGFGTFLSAGLDLSGTPAGSVFVPTVGQAQGIVLVTQDNAAYQVIQIASLASGDELYITGFYFV